MTTPARPFLFRPRLAGVLAELAQPSAAYFTREDALFISVRNSAASVEVGVRGRFMDVDGQIKPFAFSVFPSADRTDNVLVNALGEGFLVNLYAFVASGNARRGQTFVRAGLSRGIGAARVDHSILVQGYVHDIAGLAWPHGRFESPFDTPGTIRYIVGTDPIAGNDPVELVPTNARWRFLSARIEFVTSATVINRVVRTAIASAALEQVALSAANFNHPASTTRRYTIGPHGVVGDVLGGSVMIALPVDLVLHSGAEFRVSADNLQAGDNFGPPQFTVEEWITD